MKLTDDPYKNLLGANVVHAAFNYVLQSGDQGRGAVIGNTTFAEQMSFGGINKGVHTLVMCDVLIRPHCVIASNHLVGVGAAGILTGGSLASLDGWNQHGTVIIRQ